MSILAVLTVITVSSLIFIKVKNIAINRLFLFLIVFSLPLLGAMFLSGGQSFFMPINISLADIFIPPAAIYLLYKKFSENRRIDLPLLWPFLLFFMWVSVSLYAGSYKYNFVVQNTSNLVMLVKFWILLFYFYIIKNLIREPQDYKIFVLAWLLSGTISGLLGITGSLAYQILGITNIFSLAFRAMGTFGNPNLFSIQMVMCFFLAFIYNNEGGNKWLFLGLLGIFFSALIMSASKGAMLGFFVSLAVFIILTPKYRVRSFAILIPLFVVFSVAILISDKGSVYIERLSQVTDSQSFSARSRMLLWKSAFEVWQKNPIFGVGRGYYGEVSDAYENRWQILDNRARRHQTHQDDGQGQHLVTHSTYLALLCETGIIGLILFLFIIGAIILRVFKSLNALESSSSNYIVLVCLGVALISTLVQGVVTNVENNRSLWCLAGAIFSVSDWVLRPQPGSDYRLSRY
jgi:O-antigen ligase